MEFSEKLQALRKQKGLTQEELAEVLYVSRAAISKWESGRGYPNIDSLKGIAKFFSVTVDDLLSGEELLTIAEEDSKHNERRIRDLMFGLLDCSVAMFFFAPLFGQSVEGTIREASLLALTQTTPWLKTVYLIWVAGMILWGIITLALQNCGKTVWMTHKSKLSLILNAVGVLLFILSKQPYAAVYVFFMLVVKGILFTKTR